MCMVLFILDQTAEQPGSVEIDHSEDTFPTHELTRNNNRQLHEFSHGISTTDNPIYKSQFSK